MPYYVTVNAILLAYDLGANLQILHHATQVHLSPDLVTP